MPKVLRGSQGGGRFLMSEVPLYMRGSVGNAPVVHLARGAALQGYLAHKKHRPRRFSSKRAAILSSAGLAATNLKEALLRVPCIHDTPFCTLLRQLPSAALSKAEFWGPSPQLLMGPEGGLAEGMVRTLSKAEDWGPSPGLLVRPGVGALAPRFVLADPNWRPQFLTQQGLRTARLDRLHRQSRGAVTSHAPDRGTTPGADPGCSQAQRRGRHAHGCECSRTDNGSGEEERLEREHVGWRARCGVDEEAAGRVSGLGEGAVFVLGR